MIEIFALIVAGGLAINGLSTALQPATVQVCVPYVTETGQAGTACRTERDTGHGVETRTVRAE